MEQDTGSPSNANAKEDKDVQEILQLSEEVCKRIQQKRDKLLLELKELEVAKHELQEEKERMSKLHTLQSEQIKLNIGGSFFVTSISTLTKIPNTFFSAMFSGRYEIIKDKDDSVFIDRDPTHFRLILNFLRADGKLVVPPDFVAYNELYEEAQFYQIEPLIQQLQQMGEGIAAMPSRGTSVSKKFTYAHDWDSNGILFYIGNLDSSTPTGWTNPVQSGKIKLTFFPRDELNGMPEYFVDRTPHPCWLPKKSYFSSITNSWFAIDLGTKYSVIPNYYTIRDSSSGGAYQLRNWNLEGSNDGSNWDVLRAHKNDSSIATQGASASFPIVGVAKAYRHFRIIVTGPCRDPQYYFLFCSGFEIYGQLNIHEQ